NSKELTGARTSGGACGLIRRNAQNLTWVRHPSGTDLKDEGPEQSGAWTGAAWLSSARVVRCWVKSRNERNPCLQLPAFSWALWRDRRGQPGGRRGRRQVIMALKPRATHVLQWLVQRVAIPRGGANLTKPV